MPKFIGIFQRLEAAKRFQAKHENIEQILIRPTRQRVFRHA